MRSSAFFLFLLLTGTTVRAMTTVVIESWNVHLYLPSPNNLTIREYQKFTVLTEEGYKHAIRYDYQDSFRKVKSLQYTVYDATGKKVKKLSKGNAIDVLINSSYEFADARMLILDPAYRNFPFTVELEIEISYNGFLNFPFWMPRFTHGVEVRRASMTLECYKDFKYRSRELNGIDPPVISEKEGLKVVKWSTGNLVAQEHYQSFKLFANRQAQVHVTPVDFTLEKTTGTFESWTSFGEWFIRLNEGRDSLETSTKLRLNAIKQEHNGDVREITKAVYKYMQSKTRYISIQLGIGGYQTLPADLVDRNGYGDCKALTNYMKAMLDHLQIPSNYILVKAGNDAEDILADFPSNQFNHLFLAVPMAKDTLWFECTNQSLPPGYIGTFTDDRHVLWIEQGRSQVIRTPSYSAEQSTMKEHGTIHLQHQGDAIFDLEIDQSGAFFEDALLIQYAPKDIVEKANYDRFIYKDFTIQEYEFKVPDPEQAVMHMRFRMKVNTLGKPIGTKMIIPMNVLTPLEEELSMDIQNKICEVRRPFSIHDHVEIVLPENYRGDFVPNTYHDDSEFGSFEMRIEQDAKNVIHIYRKAIMKKGIYEQDTFDRFYSAVKRIRLIEQTKIVLQSKT